MCYHFMFLKPMDSMVHFHLYHVYISFYLPLRCIVLKYLTFWQDSISWGLIFAILKEGIKFHNFLVFLTSYYFSKILNFLRFLENVEQQLALTLYSQDLIVNSPL